MIEKYFKKAAPWLIGTYSCLIFLQVLLSAQYFAIHPFQPLNWLLKLFRWATIAGTIPAAFTSQRNFGLYVLSEILLILDT